MKTIEKEWFDEEGEMLYEIPLEYALNCPRNGCAVNYVNQCRMELGFKVPRNAGINYVLEHDKSRKKSELDEWDDSDLSNHILWMFMCLIRDNAHELWKECSLKQEND